MMDASAVQVMVTKARTVLKKRTIAELEVQMDSEGIRIEPDGSVTVVPNTLTVYADVGNAAPVSYPLPIEVPWSMWAWIKVHLQDEIDDGDVQQFSENTFARYE